MDDVKGIEYRSGDADEPQTRERQESRERSRTG